MSKQEQIEELKKALAEAEVSENKLRDRANKLEADRRADAETAKSYAGIVEGAAKLAREQEALDLLKLGYVKVETLRDIIRAEYSTESHPSVDITDFALRLRSTNRVEDALRAAILVKPKPKFATGGYVKAPSSKAPQSEVHWHTGRTGDTDVLPTGNARSGYFLPGTPFPAAWDLVPVPRQDVVQLSPADRQLLADIYNSVKIKFPGDTLLPVRRVRGSVFWDGNL